MIPYPNTFSEPFPRHNVKWAAYNQSLVRRGEILLAFDIIDNWDTELKEMNKDKIGEPYHYPNTFLLSYLAMPKRTFICHIDKPRALQKRTCQRKSSIHP